MKTDHITAEFLETLSFAEMMDIDRQMAEEMGERALGIWKGSRKGLIGHILERLAHFHATEGERERKRQEAYARKTDPRKAESIRDASMALLCMVQYYEDITKSPGPGNRVDPSHAGERNVGSVGYPYNWVIDQLNDIFPDNETSHECLRWYCVKAKAGEQGFTDYVLPRRRPRERNRYNRNRNKSPQK